MTREERLDLLKQIEKDIYVPSIESTFLDDAKSCAIHSAMEELEQEPRRGHWIVHPKGIYAHLICDKCLSCAPYDCKTNYCPNCGADMRDNTKRKGEPIEGNNESYNCENWIP